MKFKIKTKYIIAVCVIIAAGILYWFWYLGSRTQAYDDIPDLTSEYNADADIAKAQSALNGDVKPATVYTRDPAQKAIALTFDGLPDPTTAARLADLVQQYDIKATFFAEGSSCAGDKGSVLALQKAGIPIENYTYSGVMRLDRQPQDSVLEQLIKTQKVVETLTGTAPTLFKAPSTSYVVPLLKMAGASGLKSAVKTDVYVNKDAIKTDADAVNFINSVPQGSIVSIVLTTPVNSVVYQPGKTDDTPAVDKQPNLNIKNKPKIEHQDTVEVVERLFKAIKARNLATVPVTDMREIEREDVLQQQAAPAQNGAPQQAPAQNPAPQAAQQPQSDNGFIAAAWDRISSGLDSLLFKKAMAAPSAADTARYDALRQANNHVLAQPSKMIYTTEQSVALAFAGLSRPEVVYKVMDYLKQHNLKGTFFIMDVDLRKNPQMVQDIINSGNEVGIGIRSLKGSDFYSVCKEIETVQNGLVKMGAAKPSVAMQPWGQIPDETKEAASAMGCQLYSPTVNMVNSKHKAYTSADDVMADQFGKYVYSVGRGWIVYFRLDFYDDNDLAVQVLDLVKRHKIDNIAYNSFFDNAARNPHNDSAYSVKSIGSILADKDKLYTVDEAGLNQDFNHPTGKKPDLSFNQFLAQRYIGNFEINMPKMKGFTVEEKNYMDMTGRIQTDKPDVFFGFDDWGSDAAVNHVLYVLRKHNVKATFFVLTHNVTTHPNLLRAIAEEGHDIASHSEYHRAMSISSPDTTYDAYLQDYRIAFNKLKFLTADIKHSDGSSAFKPYFRPPTLNVSRAGVKALYDDGYDYIISGSFSVHDYELSSLEQTIDMIKKGLFDKNGKVINGAVFVVHTSDVSVYTPIAIDMLLTENEKRPDGDPSKFYVKPLSAYLDHNYNQSERVPDK